MNNPQALIGQITASILEAWPAPTDHADAIAAEREAIANYLRHGGFGASVTAAGIALPDLIRSGGYTGQTRGIIGVNGCEIPSTNGIVILPIPAGRFLMGSPTDEPDHYEDEGPQHEVELKTFFLSRTPITQAQWHAVAAMPLVDQDLDPDPSGFKGADLPVERVSWYDAMEFCARLSRQTGHTYTLPSEAQWEYACRAGTTTPFAFGETLSTEQANFSGTGTTPVGTFPGNAWGLQDMHGNVWEWCLDDWHGGYEGAPTDGSAWVEGGDSLGKSCAAARGTAVPGAAARPIAAGATRLTAIASLVSASAAPAAPESFRLLRGGSWIDFPGDCRSAYRDWGLPVIRDLGVGFRVCCLPQD